MKITKELELYHGTSASKFDNIIKNGFLSNKEQKNNFLSPQGVYFVADRPSIAYRFAKKSAFGSAVENDAPLVFTVKLQGLMPGDILDLTSDTGMNKFWKEYHIAYKAFKSNYISFGEAKQTDISALPGTGQENALTNEFVLFFRRFLSGFKPNKTNMDTFIADRLGQKFKAIVAAVQEGPPFQYQLFRNLLHYESIPSFKGIRIRDHIEVCVTDIECIDLSTVKKIDLGSLDIEPDFLDYIIYKGDDKH